MCLQDRETWNEPEKIRNVFIASFFTLGKPLAIFPTSTLSPHPPPLPPLQPHPKTTMACPKTTHIIWCIVHNPKAHLLSCDLSVRQFKRCYFWEHSVCLSVFCIARMAEETSLSLHHGSHLCKARRLQSLISAHVTSPPAFSCTLHTRGKLCARLHVWANQFDIDLGDGQFSERCDVEGSFFNSNAILIIFWKSLTSPSSRLFSLTIGNNYFSIVLLILGPIILRLFTDWLGSSERKLY